jgi:hypothetical protein
MSITEASNNIALKRFKLGSNILHPWVVLVPVLAAAAYQATGDPLECLKWTLAAYLPALIFPFLFAKVRAVMLSRRGTRQQISRSLFRDDPRQLLFLSVFFGIPSILILYCFHGPDCLPVIMFGSATTMFTIALVNLKYRASFHLSMVTGMLTALVFLFGPVSLSTFLVLSVLGFSRYRLGEHTPAQMVAGFFIGLVVSGTIFYRLGLVV